MKKESHQLHTNMTKFKKQGICHPQSIFLVIHEITYIKIYYANLLDNCFCIQTIPLDKTTSSIREPAIGIRRKLIIN